MVDIVAAIYEMMGKCTEPSLDNQSAIDHVEQIFKVS